MAKKSSIDAIKCSVGQSSFASTYRHRDLRQRWLETQEASGWNVGCCATVQPKTDEAEAVEDV
jgi:hypothetical protein